MTIIYIILSIHLYHTQICIQVIQVLCQQLIIFLHILHTLVIKIDRSISCVIINSTLLVIFDFHIIPGIEQNTPTYFLMLLPCIRATEVSEFEWKLNIFKRIYC